MIQETMTRVCHVCRSTNSVKNGVGPQYPVKVGALKPLLSSFRAMFSSSSPFTVALPKNGTNRCGNAQYHCKDCGTYSVLMPKQTYSETEQQTVLWVCLERCSQRGVFARAWQTITRWLNAHVQNLPDVKETLLSAIPDDVLELDEMWSFVRKKDHARWLWTATCRRTRHIVAFAIGDRSKATCLRLWQAILHEYKHCHTFSDF